MKPVGAPPGVRGRSARSDGRERGRRRLEVLQDDIRRQDPTEIAQDVLPGDPLRDDRAEGRQASLACSTRFFDGGCPRLCGDQPGLDVVQARPPIVDHATLMDEEAGEKDCEHACRDPRPAQNPPSRGSASERGESIPGPFLLGQQVDRTHQASTPSPIATASEARSPLEARSSAARTWPSGSSRRTRTRVSRSSSSGRPGS